VGKGAYISVGFMVSALLGGVAQAADTDKEKELEARIEQLERLVRELKATQGATAATAPSAVAGAPAAPATPAKPATAPVQAASITPNALPNTRFSYSGFVKLDTMWSQYDDGEIADGSIGRDFFVPGAIPVGGADEGADLDAHIKQSRFIFGTDTDLENGRKLLSRLEVDLYGSSLGDERATNTYGVQLRHAYIQYGNWLFGQTWSNFQDAGALPETADFIGVTDGTVFVRQPQVKYTRGPWSVSLENPETVLTPFTGVGAGGVTRISSDDNDIPDLTLAYNWKVGTGYLRVAALARQLKYETTGVTAIDNSEFAGSLSVAGKFNIGKDDVRFSFTGGEGFGRYVGVNFANDAVLTATGEIDAISGWAGFIAYRHLWNAKLRTNLMYSLSDYDNDPLLTGLAVNKSSSSWAINAIYSPVSKLDFGLEWRWAEREIESGLDGSMQRLQGIVKYSF